jgi:Tfp pilus assembly protein PilF
MVQSPNDGFLMMMTIARAGETSKEALKLAKKRPDVPNKFGTFFLHGGL